MNTLGNIALFLPLGILLPLLSNRFRSLSRVLLVALCLSLSIETTQFVLRFVGNPRAVDIDDVILNTLGACLGFAFYTYFIASYVTGRPARDGQIDSGVALLEDMSADSTDSAQP